MNILKGIGAIVVAFIFIAVTHNGTDFILEYLGIFTPPTVRFDTTWMVIAAIIYRNLFLIAAGYIAAALAPQPKMMWVIVLAIVGTLFGIIGVYVGVSMDLGPAWYPIALVILGFPSVWLGGKLRVKN